MIFGLRIPPLLAFTLIAALYAAPIAAQRDFLTRDEIDLVRDAQEPEKRIILYLEIAQLRLDSIRTAITASKPDGRRVQRNLNDYIQVSEAILMTIEDAREDRVPIPESIEQMVLRVPEYLGYLESINSSSSPAWADYQFTLDEAILMTGELTDEAAQGSFPEVDERTPPPLEFPTKPPPAARGSDKGDSDEAGSDSDEEGPPRKPGR